MVKLALALVVVVALGYANGLDCFGSTCTADQYCEVMIHTNSGHCYTHHGHGHHEDHQACIGAHHPGDHCFCKDQACVDNMKNELASTAAPAATTAAPAATTTMGAAANVTMDMTTMPPTMPQTTI